VTDAPPEQRVDLRRRPFGHPRLLAHFAPDHFTRARRGPTPNAARAFGPTCLCTVVAPMPAWKSTVSLVCRCLARWRHAQNSGEERRRETGCGPPQAAFADTVNSCVVQMQPAIMPQSG
jgi:hypothetical protein